MKSKIVSGVGVICLGMLVSVGTLADMPKIIGTPVLDTPKILEWSWDEGLKIPNLDNPTADLLWDFHGTLNECDLLLSIEGNYHMALHDI